MKILTLIFLLLSFTIHAQIRTGGGGSLEHPELGFADEYEFSLSAPQPITIKTRSFIAKLSAQEKICRSEGKRYLTIDMDFDFMKAYLKLSILQSTFIADDKCQDVGEYFKCLYTPEVREELKQIIDDHGMKKYLQLKYKIDKKQAREMLKFFEKLDKTCHKAKCEM